MGCYELISAQPHGDKAPFCSRRILGALLLLSVVVRIGVVLNSVLNFDESQHLHASWLVTQGQIPFVDFWEHHSPLLYYLLAPLTRWLVGRPDVYFAGRALMALCGIVATLITYYLARRLSESIAVATIILLAFLPRFVEHTTEVRPDPPALVFSLGAVLALVRWAETDASGWLWSAGLALGSAIAFTPKAMYVLPGMVTSVILGRAQSSPRFRGAVSRLTQLGLGATAPVLAGIGALAWQGGRPAVHGLLTDVVLGNLHFADFAKMTPIPEESVGFLLLACAGLVVTLWRLGWRAFRHPVHGPILLSLSSMILVLAAPVTPAVYRHSWLPALPLLAIYGGVALASLGAWARGASGARPAVCFGLALLAGVVIPAAAQIRTAVRDQNHRQLALIRQELADTCAEESVLDGTALAVFRPSAHRYGVLVTGIRAWIARGLLDENVIVTDLSRTRPPLADLDIRLRGLVGGVGDFVRRYYVGRPGELLRLGTTLSVSEPGGRATVELLASGTYRLTVPRDLDLAIDGVRARSGFVWLGQGPHALAWSGRPGRLDLVLATCAERRVLAGWTGSTNPRGTPAIEATRETSTAGLSHHLAGRPLEGEKPEVAGP